MANEYHENMTIDGSLLQLYLITPIEETIKGDYTFADYRGDVHTIIGGVDNRKLLDDLRVIYSPIVLIFEPDIEDEDTLLQMINFKIPISNFDYARVSSRLFKFKERIVELIKKSFETKFTDSIVNDQYLVSLQQLELQLIPPKYVGQLFLGDMVQMDETPGVFDLLLIIRYIDESKIRPNGIYSREAKMRFERSRH